MKEESRKIEESSFTGKVIQITNVSPGATLQQMATLFGFLGTVTDIRLYPSDEDISVAVKLCYIQYDNSEQCGIAQHLTNTVFIDKALIVVPINRTEVPEENECVSLLKSINAYAGMSTAVLMNHITPSDNEIPPLPPVPVVTTATDPVEIDEIRRTIFVQNIPPDITADQLMAFFSGVGEVKYLRLCKGDSGKYAFVEFTALDSVPTALQYNGVLFGGRCLKVDYSKHPIIKPDSDQIAIGRSSARKSRRRSRSRTPRSRSRTRRSRSRSIKRSPIRKRSISRSPRRKRSITRSPRRRRSPSRFPNNGLRGLNRESRKDTEPVNTIDRRRRSRRSISRSRSPRRKSRSITPRRKSKSRSPIKKSISKSPIRKSKSVSPRVKSKSPKRSKSRSPRRKSKSKSPKRRSRSRSIRRRSRSKSPKRKSRSRSPRKKSRRRSHSKSPRKKSKKSISPERSSERSSVKKKKKDKSKETEKSTEEELQSLLTKIYTFEEEREKEKKSKEKNRESSDESTKSKKKKKKSSSRE